MYFYGDKMIQLTFHFDSIAAATEFLAAQGERPPQADVQPTLAERTETTDISTPEPVKKARQPRSDAGKSRGPYKKSNESAAPAQTVQDNPASPAPTAVAADPVPAPVAALTVDAIKAEMSILSKKKGIDANIQLLAKFGVQKISSLPEARYAEFVAAVRAAVAA
jgi:hypothetical protein